MAKTGRPTSYNQRIGDAICEEMATTDHSLRRICEAESMPSPSTVYLWLDGSDLQDRPLSERKTLLRKLLPRPSRAVLYVEHVANGTDLFRLICERDMEGVVAKQASARYTPEATTWVKIKNREYSQAVGREDFFDHRRAAK